MKQLLQSRASGRGPGATNTLLRWLCLPLAALCVAAATPAGAASYNFTGASTAPPSPFGLNAPHWPDAVNWSPPGGSPGVGGSLDDVVFPTLGPGLLTSFGGMVINDGPALTLVNVTFNATHAYFIALSNCAPMQINGTLTKHGPFEAAIHGHNGRLHLNNPVLAGTGTGPIFVFRPESIMGPSLSTAADTNGTSAARRFARRARLRRSSWPPRSRPVAEISGCSVMSTCPSRGRSMWARVPSFV